MMRQLNMIVISLTIDWAFEKDKDINHREYCYR
jgi:hypothetical protein